MVFRSAVNDAGITPSEQWHLTSDPNGIIVETHNPKAAKVAHAQAALAKARAHHNDAKATLDKAEADLGAAMDEAAA